MSDYYGRDSNRGEHWGKVRRSRMIMVCSCPLGA